MHAAQSADFCQLLLRVPFVSMVLSAAQVAKRAFVRILLAFATQYQVSLSVSRDSADKDILAAYRRLVKKVHPDKGGKKEDQQKLQDAKVEWEDPPRQKEVGFMCNFSCHLGARGWC